MWPKSIPSGITVQDFQFQTAFHGEHSTRYNKKMPTIAEVLSRLMADRGLNSNSLANAINAGKQEAVVHQGTIWKIVSGKTKEPGAEVITPIAEFLGVSLPELRGEIAIQRNLDGVPERFLPEGKYLFPRAYEDVVAGLGKGRFNADFHVEIEGTMPVPRDLILSRGWRAERLAVVRTEGASMYPTINDGEPVLINLDDVKIVSGKVYAIEDADEGLRIKRLYQQHDRRIRVVCDNPDKISFPDDFLTPDTQARIVGRVVYRSGEL
jgi:transcriptional regulator with XRE-family HTH domain